MKHPYYVLVENISKYSKVLSKDDIKQIKPNVFQIDDIDFDALAFFNDVKKETNISPIEHAYIGASCSDPLACYKPYRVYGFDNVMFYIKNKVSY